MAFVGDTVRLKVKFRTFNGNAVDPLDVNLRVLDGDNYQEVETVAITNDNKVDVGVYEYDYVIPYGESDTLIYEFSGTHNNKPILSRGRFDRDFI